MGRQRGNVGFRRYAPVAAIAIAVTLVVALLAWLVVGISDQPPKAQKKIVQQVQVIRPPPPPEVEPPPPPEPEKVEIDEPEPEPELADAEPPTGEQLGLDADGVAGGDAFGLMARKGGRDLLSTASDSRFNWYGNVLKNDLMDRLAEIRDIRRDSYSVVVRLWLGSDGQVKRFQVANSTGNDALDRDLVAALESLDRVSEIPPAGMPQPVRVRIVSRT